MGAQKQKHKKQPFGDVSASHLSLVLWHVWFQACLNQPLHITNAALLRGRWHRQKDKNRSPSAKNQNLVGTWYFTSAHNWVTMLNINHLAQTRSVASLPCKIVLENLMDFWPRNYFIIRGFSPWNGERFLSLGQSGSTLLQGCFYVFCFWFHWRFGKIAYMAKFE